MTHPYPGWPAERPSPARFDLGPQSAAMINNVGGNQYLAARESFLREVAATRTRARWLVWSGVALFLIGFGVFAAGVLRFLKQVSQSVGNDVQPSASPFGSELFGVQSGLLGWATAAFGAVLIIIGIVLHIIATSRRRKVDMAYPVAGRRSAGY